MIEKEFCDHENGEERFQIKIQRKQDDTEEKEEDDKNESRKSLAKK